MPKPEIYTAKYIHYREHLEHRVACFGNSVYTVHMYYRGGWWPCKESVGTKVPNGCMVKRRPEISVLAFVCRDDVNGQFGPSQILMVSGKYVHCKSHGSA